MADLLAIKPSVSLGERPRESKRSSAIVVNRVVTFPATAINANLSAAESLVDIDIYTRNADSIDHKRRAILVRSLLRIIFENLAGLYDDVRILGCQIQDEGNDIVIAPNDASDNWTYFTALSLQVFHSVVAGDIVYPSGGD